VEFSQDAHSFIVLLFSASCLLAVLLTEYKKVQVPEMIGAGLCLPLIVQLAGQFGGYWGIVNGPFESWRWLILLPNPIPFG
jgi:hypothetical protein